MRSAATVAASVRCVAGRAAGSRVIGGPPIHAGGSLAGNDSSEAS